MEEKTVKKSKSKTRIAPGDADNTCGLDIVLWRTQRGMSQRELSYELGLSLRQLQNLEADALIPARRSVHWALKGMHLQTKCIRHLIVHLDGRVIMSEDIVMEQVGDAPDYKTPEGDLWVWLEIVPAPMFLSNPPGVPMADPLDNPYYKQVDATKEAARLRRNELQRQRYRENK